MSRFCPLFSGSSGNCTYIGTSNEGVLVDVGGSYKSICNSLEGCGASVESIKAVCITHEHGDHIGGLKIFLKKHPVPVIASKQTINSLREKEYIPESAAVIEIDGSYALNEITVTRFETSHDCPGSSGYTFSLSDGRRAAVCTDLGYISDTVKSALIGCDIVLLESNHDINMLHKGPYPPQTKARIAGDCGHLSNTACAAVLPELVKNGTTRILLGHISQNNNTPLLALRTSKTALTDAGYNEGVDYILYAAPKKEGKMFTL